MANFTRRQQYWQDLFIIRSATGHLNRRMSFAAAHDWVYAYTYEIRVGYDIADASQRAYDCLVFNKRATLISMAEVKGYAWNF